MHGRKGGVHGRGHAWQGVCVAGGMHCRGGMHSRGHVWQVGMHDKGGMHHRGACMAGAMSARAGGTHPTGKHSCKIFFLLIVKEWTAFHNWPSRNPSRSDCECP